MMASHSRMFARNLLPKPWPSDAPSTSPAMSTISTAVGTIFFVPDIRAKTSRRPSNTGTVPKLGSIVQKGKLAACARLFSTNALKSVLLPTLGSPTIPVFRDARQFECKVRERAGPKLFVRRVNLPLKNQPSPRSATELLNVVCANFCASMSRFVQFLLLCCRFSRTPLVILSGILRSTGCVRIGLQVLKCPNRSI